LIMSSIRRYVKRSDPPREVTFDQQFWPVVVATMITSGFLVGAIVTLANQAWLWGLLILMPAAIASTILVLWMVPNRWIRRSLQLAIMISMAINLFFIIMASGVDVFSKVVIDVESPPVSRKKQKTISMSKRMEQEWLQLNEVDQPTNDASPDVKRIAAQAMSKWESQPVKSEHSEDLQPQLIQRKMNQTSQPKLGSAPSKLSRHERQTKPQSTENPSATAASASAKTSSPADQNTNDSVQVTRQSQQPEIQNSTSEQAVVQKATPSPTRKQVENSQQLQQASTASQTRRTRRTPSAATVAQQSKSAADSSRATSQVEASDVKVQRSSASAKIESETTDPATVAQNAPTRSNKSSSTNSTNPTEIKRSAVAAQSQSPNASSTAEAAKPSQSNSQLVAQNSQLKQKNNNRSATVTQPEHTQQNSNSSAKVARQSIQRKIDTQTQSVPNPLADQAPRRARNTAAALTSPSPTESPSRSTQPTVATEQGSADAQSLSLTRSESGVAGQGTSANLASETASSQSPAKIASDSFNRSRTQQNQSPLNLNSSQASTTPRSFAGETKAASVLKQSESNNAKLPGQVMPQDVSANASATITDSTSKRSTDSLATEVGNARADIGPTKLVMETNVDRPAGGGQPEIENTGQPRPMQNSGKTSPVASVATVEQSNRPTAPFEAGHPTPSSQNPDAADESSIVQHSQSDSPLTQGPSESASDSNTEIAQPSSDSQSDLQGLARAEKSDDEDEEEDAQNNAPGKLARLVPRAGQSQTAPSNNDNNSAVASDQGDAGAEGSVDATQTAVARRTSSSSNVAGNQSSDDGEIATTESSSAMERADSQSVAPETGTTHPGTISRSNGAIASDAQSPNAGTSPATVADTKGSNSPTSGIDSRGLNAARVAAKNIPGSAIGSVAKSAMGIAASALPLVQSPSRNQSSDPANEGDGASQPSNLGRTHAGSAARIASASPNSETDQNSGVANDATGTADSGEATNSAESVDVSKRQNDGMALDIEAADGPAGLGKQLDRDPGVTRRNASKDQQSLESLVESRFLRNQPGGRKAVSPARIKANMAFRSRRPESIRNSAPHTTEYIDNGLEFLARYQRADGSWSLSQFDPGWTQNRVSANQIVTRLDSDTAATGLAVLAFQGAGYNHKEYKYARNLDSAIQWLIENQQESGLLYVSTQRASDANCKLYSHGIATIALTEAYGMTQDPALKEPVQKAIDYIVRNQDPDKGGWRYNPGSGTDTSVSGWMVMALHSARLAGVEFDQEVWEGVDSWLNQARHPQLPYKFRYNPFAEGDAQNDRDHQREVTQNMTSVALLMKLYTGWTRDQVEMQMGADYLLTKLPSDKNQYYRDTYYWYYATQVMAHIGGEPWEKWNGELEKLLVNTQVKGGPMAGSWDPYLPVPDRWGHYAGRLYVTTMNILSLEVRHRMLPIYDDIVQQNLSLESGAGK
jgi:hypothetical protein